MKKRIWAALCAAALIVVFCTPFVRAEGTVYILAVNDKFCDLANGVRPVAIENSIYIPYTVFDKVAAGDDLDVYYGLSRENRGVVLSLYSKSGSLKFFVDVGSCKDRDGNEMGFQSYTRNGIPYVPAAEVCDYFGLSYSLIPTADRGTLVRIKNTGKVWLTDRQFISIGERSMLNRYNEVIQATAVSTPSPSPTLSNPSEPPKENVQVYLSVDASSAEDILFSIFPEGTYGLFLLTPESLIKQARQVREAVAAGHSIGLIVEGTGEEAEKQLERGNDLLKHIARIHTRIVYAPDELTDYLEERGWVCWRPNVMGAEAATILDVLNRRSGVGKIKLPASEREIQEVLRGLRRGGYAIQRPLETDL